ncbi:MAG: hypothetical protein JNN27_21330 [Planctomycetes bacterium]|nr:hypothetical protein [Planctomycetota bacterium]
MASLLSWLRRGPDWRPEREIAADVEAELAFHVEQATEQGVREGLSREAARAAALARFGDVERVRRECVAIRTEGSAMRVKLLATAVGVLFLATCALGLGLVAARRASAARDQAVRAEAEALRAHLEAERAAREAAESRVAAATGASSGAQLWLERFRIGADNWQLGWAVAVELVAQLPPEEAWTVMREVFPQLSVPQREQVLKPFVFHGGHPRALDLLDLAMRDPAQSVCSRAAYYLREYAFEDFERDPAAYERWRAAHAGKDLAATVRDSLTEYAARLAALTPNSLEPAAVESHLAEFEALDFKAARQLGVEVDGVLRSSGAADVVDEFRRRKDREGYEKLKEFLREKSAVQRASK